MKITCDCKHTRKMKELEPFQGNLKSMSPKERSKLITLIETYGLRFPFYVWGNKIIDGHQKYDVLTNDFKYEGIIPVVEIEAESEKEARELVLVSGSKNGRYNLEDLQDFTADMSDVENFSLLDGPDINLNFKVGLTPKTSPLIEDIEIVDSDEYEQAEVEEIKTNVGDVMTFPDGTILTAGDDRYFFEECIRMWNSRNKKLQVSLTKVSN